MKSKKLLNIITLLLSAAGCTDLPRPLKPDVPADNLLIVGTTDFSTGFISAVSLDDLTVYKDIQPAHSDFSIASEGTAVYTLNKLGADSITRSQPAESFSIQYSVSAGSKTNPYDIVEIGSNRAAVSLYGQDYLLLIDTITGKTVSQIDLPAYADADGIPETSSLFYRNGRLYVFVQRLDRNTTSSSIWPPAGQSYLLKINSTFTAVEKSFTLPFTNPVSRARYFTERNSIIIAAPGNYGANYSLDGGVIEFDLDTETFLISPLTEQQAGLEISDAVLVSSTLGFAICSDASFNSYFIAFNPSTHAMISTLAQIPATTGGYFSGMAYHNGRLYLGDRKANGPGIRIFNTTTLNEITQTPLDTGLPPVSLELYQPQ